MKQFKSSVPHIWLLAAGLALTSFLGNPIYGQIGVRDPQSALLLGQCVANLGDPTKIMGFGATGVIQSINSTQQTPFVFESRGILQSFLAIETPLGKEIHRSSGGHGQVRLANGVIKAKPDTSSRYAWPQFIPALSCAWPLLDPAFSIQYVESTKVQESPADHIRVFVNVLGSDGTVDTDEALISTIDIYLDSSSHLPVRTTVRAFGTTGIQNSIPVDTYYSLYSQSQGVMFPATMTEYVQGNLNRIITIQSTSFNQTFADADFTLEVIK